MPKKYTIEDIKEFAKKSPFNNIHYLPYVTCGTVSSMQWIRSDLDMNKPLIIANCDQMIKYDSKVFKKSVGLNGVGSKAVNALSSNFSINSIISSILEIMS